MTATGTYTTAMFLKAGVACCLVAAAALSAADRGRVDRAIALSGDRLTQWLGPAPAEVQNLRFSPPAWSAPVSMALESEAAFQLARARFAAIVESPVTRPFLDGVSWHLQSRIVEDLFDLEHRRPGHHAIDVPLFGHHATWAIPSLVVSRNGRDERAAPALAHAAEAVRTLEHVVGWPSLAAALRVLSSLPGPIDRAGIQASLESSLGVPVAWFLAALEPDFRVDHTLVAVASEAVSCGNDRCFRSTIDVARTGAALFPDAGRSGALRIAIEIDFGTRPTSTIWWDGEERARLTVESGAAPLAVRLDPGREISLDADQHDHQWRAAPAPAPRPIKALASWLVWLQNAALSYAVLL